MKNTSETVELDLKQLPCLYLCRIKFGGLISTLMCRKTSRLGQKYHPSPKNHTVKNRQFVLLSLSDPPTQE
jgi:hypothetical protein